MEREIRLWLWLSVLIGFLFASWLGLRANDPGMIQGAFFAALGGFVVTPFVARLWRGEGEP